MGVANHVPAHRGIERKGAGVSYARRHNGTSTATQCRKMGLQVGDTIQGREGTTKWWGEARLTLLWLGKDVAVWDSWRRSSDNQEWEHIGEEADWTLDCRAWKKVTRSAS